MQKAGTAFRWTGSWMTVFTAVDPLGSEQISVDEEIQLVELLNRYRLAGYESYAPPPDYVSIDLRIEVCVLDGWLDGDVEASVLNVLGSSHAAGRRDRLLLRRPLHLRHAALSQPAGGGDPERAGRRRRARHHVPPARRLRRASSTCPRP